MRPSDPRLSIYPAQFITDKHMLPPNHPQTLKDLKRSHFEPTYYHVDPYSDPHKNPTGLFSDFAPKKE